MVDLKGLSDELKKVKIQIEKVLSISGYRNDDDLSALEDFKQIKTADQRQQLEEYRDILDKLDDIQYKLVYLEKPIQEVSRIYTNESGRYETDRGYYYTSGSGIEFLRTEEVYNDDTDTWESAEIWTTSRVESKDGRYYIVGYPNLEMSGLKVRIRR